MVNYVFAFKDLSAGCFGVEGEGWFDPSALLQGYKRKAISLGVNYVHGEVIINVAYPSKG